ncbi:4-(cytidine 5'-diphospho)-2-C-methyl-D-erythritol kinase [Acidovorax lacteus]|uniref:4-diphosphocytidyl-2-C-methyl-D-erythritol kinase n=1 Tax=Acidovorax lacteus TaxID=1924988 RepID=A0ABP8L8T4_9BURK
MRTLYDVPAPAKLNLFLHITGRRHDGYHLLQSVFMLIDWCDLLDFDIRSDGQISREDLEGSVPCDDLCTRAARLLQTRTACPRGVHIGLRKRLPAQAGMGGGSSDAASTLLALNRLWGLQLPLPTLLELGLQLGADVPFFLQGRNAWVEGIGEKITPLSGAAALPPQRWIVVKPTAGLDTSRIFSAPNLKRDTNSATIAGFAAAHYDFGRNDLQPVAQALCPDVTTALDWLELRGLQGRMTGSGSAVFARISHDWTAGNIPDGWQVKTCDNLGLHPLAGWAPEKIQG